MLGTNEPPFDTRARSRLFKLGQGQRTLKCAPLPALADVSFLILSHASANILFGSARARVRPGWRLRRCSEDKPMIHILLMGAPLQVLEAIVLLVEILVVHFVFVAWVLYESSSDKPMNFVILRNAIRTQFDDEIPGFCFEWFKHVAIGIHDLTTIGNPVIEAFDWLPKLVASNEKDVGGHFETSKSSTDERAVFLAR